MRRVVLDTETTGLDHKGADRVVEIGAWELEDLRITGNYWHTRVNPRVKIEPGAQRVHGISNEMLEGEPEFWEVYEDLLDFVASDPIIGHNMAAFDIHFLNKECRLAGKPALENAVIDTLEMAKNRRPGQHNNLDALVKAFKIKNDRTNGQHGALVDAEMTAKVYCHLMQTGGDQQFDFAPEAVIQDPVQCVGQVVRQATPDELDLHSLMCAELKISAWQQRPRQK